MKTIKFPADKSGEFRAILANIIGNDPQGGYTIAEVRSGMRVLDALSCEGTDLLLDDVDHAFVQERVGRVRFVKIDADVILFLDAIGV